MTRTRALALSSLAHFTLLGSLSVTWLLVVEPVPEPPISIRFVSGPPLAPILQPLPSQDPLPETLPEKAAPASRPEAAPPPPAPAERPPERPPEPSDATAQVASEPASPVAPSVESTASVTIARKDSFDPPELAPRYVPGSKSHAVSIGAVDSFASGTAGVDAADPGHDVLKRVATGRSSGAGAGASGGPASSLPGRLAPLPSSRPGSAAGSRPVRPATPGDHPNPEEIEGGSAAEKFGRRYSLQLVDARGLGHSTHDGWRYSQLLPLLSEAYRRVAPLGSAAASGRGPDEDVESVRIDPDAIAISYRDGTRHVVAPTHDGLVALYVAAGPAGRSKVDEIQRALGALRRLLHAEVRS